MNRLNTRSRASGYSSPASPSPSGSSSPRVFVTTSHQRPLSPAAALNAGIIMPPTFPPPMFPHAQAPPPLTIQSPPSRPPPQPAAQQPKTPLSKKRSLSLLNLTPSPSSTPPTSLPPKRARQAPVNAPPPAPRPDWVDPAESCPAFTEEFNSIPLRQGGGEGVLASVVNGGLLVLVVVNGIVSHWSGMQRVRALLKKEGRAPGDFNKRVAVFAVGSEERSEGVPCQPGGEEIPYLWDYSRRLHLRLSLLHPLGGGREGLNAVLVFDAKGRRRISFRIGWKGEGDQGVEEVVWRVVSGVEWLLSEEEGGAEVGGMEVEMG